MSPVSEIERKVSAMPKEFRDWFSEAYHIACSCEGRQMTDEEIETAMIAWQASRAALPKVTAEEIAKYIFAAMQTAAQQFATDKAPEWVEGGNSIAQDVARTQARAILQKFPFLTGE